MSDETEQFYSDVDGFVDDLIEDSPVTGTFLGEHRYDDRLGEFTGESLELERKRLSRWLRRFEGYAADGWLRDAAIDRTLIAQIVKSWIRELDRVRSLYRDPGSVVRACLGGVHLLVVRDFAPLPERMKSVLGRLREIPRVLSEGRALIVPREVPPVWAEVAAQSARQGIGLVARFIPALAESTPEIKAAVAQAAETAATALAEYASWIEETVAPQASGDFAVGEEFFNELLRENHMVAYDADALLGTGWRLYEETRRQMLEVARRIDATRTVDEVIEEAKRDHPSAGNLLEAYRGKMAEARQFVIDHEIASIPPAERIRVVETPPHMRPLIPYGAYMMPGVFEAVQEGIFVVTPVEEGADDEAVERKLRGHPLANIPVIALHEAYPGHHLQLTVANTLESLPRKLGSFLSTLFIEGWAFYCEELMEQLGFISMPIQKLSRLKAQLWRASRIIIDVSLHTRQMSVDEGIAFLVERAGLEPDDARAEVRRYTAHPTQPQSYLMGKLEILDIVAEHKRRRPQATMRETHDAILRSGSLPPPLLRLALFGDDGDGGASARPSDGRSM